MKKTRVVIFDEDPMYRALKKNPKLEISINQSGEEALAALERKPAEIVIVDLMTPFEKGGILLTGDGVDELFQKREKDPSFQFDHFDMVFPKESPAERFLRTAKERGLLNSSKIILMSGIGDFENSKSRVSRFREPYGVKHVMSKCGCRHDRDESLKKIVDKCLKQTRRTRSKVKSK